MQTKYDGYKLDFKYTLVGFQFLFVAFGALVLVPILTGLSTSVALFTAGLGTLIFQLVTRKNIPPVFLGSSFAFIAPLNYAIKEWGINAAMGAIIAAGFVYIILSFIIRIKGDKFLHKVLPPVVVGPVIMTIGLILSPVAVKMAIGDGQDYSQNIAMICAFSSLFCTLIIMMFSKGIIRLIPILCGIFFGYIVAYFFGIINFQNIIDAPWISIPEFTTPKFEINAIVYMLPIAIAPAVEHIGDMLAISNVTKENFLKNPGLKNTLLGDGLATSLAGLFGGPPNTTYSEVTGAVSITRAYNPAIMTFAAIFAILLAFLGKLGAIIQSIPTPVIGGVMLLLFGVVASVGMQTLIKHKVDLGMPRNIVIVSLILVSAIGGMSINFGIFTLSGIGLGAVVGIILNLLLPNTKHLEGY